MLCYIIDLCVDCVGIKISHNFIAMVLYVFYFENGASFSSRRILQLGEAAMTIQSQLLPTIYKALLNFMILVHSLEKVVGACV